MIFLIKKIINRNTNDIESSRIKFGVFASILSVLFNMTLFCVKLFVGILSNSVSIVADAINNLTDMGSCIISFIGFKISSKPADEEHPYGHQRAEYITSLIVSIIIIIVGIEILSSSVTKIFIEEVAQYSTITIVVLVVSIVIKAYLAYFNYKIGKEINSLTLIATAKDCLNDTITTFVILLSSIASILFNLNIDGYMGVLVAIFILYSGIKLVKETISPLLGEKVDVDLVSNIINEIKSNSNVLGVHDVMTHSYGPTRIFMSLHVEVDSSKNILEIHEEIDELESRIKKIYKVSLVIHMDPIELNCELTNEYKNRITSHLSSINNCINMHDFRIVNGNENINIIFDIVVPRNCERSNDDIEKSIYNLLENDSVNIKLIITFDDDFSTIN